MEQKKKKLGLVHCRICKQPIDREIDTDWIMKSRNFYYHKSCYNNWRESDHSNDEAYIELIYDYISHDLKINYDYFLCEAQRKKFLKENKMTNKGILFSLKYFYEVQKGDREKSHGGIGIVPYIYKEACEYWVERERRNKGIVEKIEQQMREAKDRRHRVVKAKRKKKPAKTIDLASIEGMEDE